MFARFTKKGGRKEGREALDLDLTDAKDDDGLIGHQDSFKPRVVAASPKSERDKKFGGGGGNGFNATSSNKFGGGGPQTARSPPTKKGAPTSAKKGNFMGKLGGIFTKKEPVEEKRWQYGANLHSMTLLSQQAAEKGHVDDDVAEALDKEEARQRNRPQGPPVQVRSGWSSNDNNNSSNNYNKTSNIRHSSTGWGGNQNSDIRGFGPGGPAPQGGVHGVTQAVAQTTAKVMDGVKNLFSRKQPDLEPLGGQDLEEEDRSPRFNERRQDRKRDRDTHNDITKELANVRREHSDSAPDRRGNRSRQPEDFKDDEPKSKSNKRPEFSRDHSQEGSERESDGEAPRERQKRAVPIPRKKGGKGGFEITSTTEDVMCDDLDDEGVGYVQAKSTRLAFDEETERPRKTPASHAGASHHAAGLVKRIGDVGKSMTNSLSHVAQATADATVKAAKATAQASSAAVKQASKSKKNEDTEQENKGIARGSVASADEPLFEQHTSAEDPHTGLSDVLSRALQDDEAEVQYQREIEEAQARYTTKATTHQNTDESAPEKHDWQSPAQSPVTSPVDSDQDTDGEGPVTRLDGPCGENGQKVKAKTNKKIASESGIQSTRKDAAPATAAARPETSSRAAGVSHHKEQPQKQERFRHTRAYSNDPLTVNNLQSPHLARGAATPLSTPQENPKAEDKGIMALAKKVTAKLPSVAKQPKPTPKPAPYHAQGAFDTMNDMEEHVPRNQAIPHHQQNVNIDDYYSGENVHRLPPQEPDYDEDETMHKYIEGDPVLDLSGVLG